MIAINIDAMHDADSAPAQKTCSKVSMQQDCWDTTFSAPYNNDLPDR